MDRPRASRTPTAAILRGWGPSGSTQTPGYPGRRPTSVSPRSVSDVDHELFDRRDVGDSVGHPSAALAGDGQNRIADQLTWAVVGDVAPTVRPYELRTHGGRVDEDVVELPVHAERVHVRMLEQQQPVLPTVLEQAVLQRERVVVGDPPEPTYVQAQSSASQSRVSITVLT